MCDHQTTNLVFHLFALLCADVTGNAVSDSLVEWSCRCRTALFPSEIVRHNEMDIVAVCLKNTCN